MAAVGEEVLPWREKKSAITRSLLQRMDPMAVSPASAITIAGALKKPCNREAMIPVMPRWMRSS